MSLLVVGIDHLINFLRQTKSFICDKFSLTLLLGAFRGGVSSLQHNIPRSFYLNLVFWNLLQIIQLSICDVIVIIKKRFYWRRANSHLVGGVKSLTSHSFIRLTQCDIVFLTDIKRTRNIMLETIALNL